METKTEPGGAGNAAAEVKWRLLIPEKDIIQAGDQIGWVYVSKGEFRHEWKDAGDNFIGKPSRKGLSVRRPMTAAECNAEELLHELKSLTSFGDPRCGTASSLIYKIEGRPVPTP